MKEMSFVRKILCLLVITIISGCAVHKAATNDGVSVDDIKKCKVRDCLLSHGMSFVEEKKASDGSVIKTYRGKARKSGITYGRAAGHAVLDVATLGLWEIVGTPVEGAMSENRGFIVAKAKFAKDDNEEIISIQIYDPSGKVVHN